MKLYNCDPDQLGEDEDFIRADTKLQPGAGIRFDDEQHQPEIMHWVQKVVMLRLRPH